MKKQVIVVGLSATLGASIVMPGIESQAATTLKVKAGKLIDQKSGKKVKGFRVFKKKLYKNGVLYKAKVVIGTGTKRTLYVNGVLAKGTQTATNGTLLFKAGKLAKGTIQYDSKKTLYVDGVRAKGTIVYKGAKTSYLYKNGTLTKGEIQFNSKKSLYVNGALANGITLYKANGLTYVYQDGIWSKKTQLVKVSDVDTLFVKGLQAKGNVLFNGKLYVEGFLAKGIQKYNDIYYADGNVANGTIEDVEYVDGQLKVELTMKQLQEHTAELQSLTEDFVVSTETKEMLEKAIEEYEKNNPPLESTKASKLVATPQTSSMVSMYYQAAEFLVLDFSGLVQNNAPRSEIQTQFVYPAQQLMSDVDGELDELASDITDLLNNNLSPELMENTLANMHEINGTESAQLPPSTQQNMENMMSSIMQNLMQLGLIGGTLGTPFMNMDASNQALLNTNLQGLTNFMNTNSDELGLPGNSNLLPSQPPLAPPTVTSIQTPDTITILVGHSVILPLSVMVTYSDGSKIGAPVNWKSFDNSQAGKKTVSGVVLTGSGPLSISMDVIVEEDEATKAIEKRVALLRLKINQALATMKPVSQSEDGKDVIANSEWTTQIVKDTYEQKLKLFQSRLAKGSLNALSLQDVERSFEDAKAEYTSQIEGKVDFSELETYIRLANERIDEAVVVEDSLSIPESDPWIFTSDLATFRALINKSEKWVKEATLTQEEVQQAAYNLEKAINSYIQMGH